jgi:hypothetical protein
VVVGEALGRLRYGTEVGFRRSDKGIHLRITGVRPRRSCAESDPGRGRNRSGRTFVATSFLFGRGESQMSRTYRFAFDFDDFGRPPRLPDRFERGSDWEDDWDEDWDDDASVDGEDGDETSRDDHEDFDLYDDRDAFGAL